MAGLVYGPLAPQTVYAGTHQPLDGIGMKTYHYPYSALGMTQLLTTARGHDVIILFCYCAPPVTILDSSGLVFTERLAYGDFIHGSLFEYYAIADSPLKSDNITVIPNQQEVGMQVVAIHGANTNRIFDPNLSVPATVSSQSSLSIETSTIDFVLAATAINDDPACGAAYLPIVGVPGFTTVTTSPGYAGNFEFDYRTTTMPHETIHFNCTQTSVEGIVLDAVSLRP
jgi:hypothetical protein